MRLEKLARYQIWADDAARRLLADLTDEEFDREVLPPFGSIRKLTAHIVLAMEFNIEMRARKRELDPYEVGDMVHALPRDDLLEKWRETDMKFLETVGTETGEIYVFPSFLGEGEMTVDHTDFCLQYLLHTAHHRAQIMSALRAMGKEAETTDYLFYLSHLNEAVLKR